MKKTDNEISVYTDEVVRSEEIAIAIKKLSVAFPKMNVEFWNLLSEFVVSENFTSQRLKDAINHVIMNFQYKELNISDIIKFDKKIKLYTYNEVFRMIEKNEVSGFDEFENKEINGKVYRIKKSDIEKYI